MLPAGCLRPRTQYAALTIPARARPPTIDLATLLSDDSGYLSAPWKMVSLAPSGGASAARSFVPFSAIFTRVRSKWLPQRSDLSYLSALLTLLLSRPVPLWCSGVLLSDIGLAFSLLLLESLSLMMSYWRQKRAITAAGSDARDGGSVRRRQLSLTHVSTSHLKGWIMEGLGWWLQAGNSDILSRFPLFCALPDAA